MGHSGFAVWCLFWCMLVLGFSARGCSCLQSRDRHKPIITSKICGIVRNLAALCKTPLNGLKIRRPQGRGGSSPPLGTMAKARISFYAETESKASRYRVAQLCYRTSPCLFEHELQTNLGCTLWELMKWSCGLSVPSPISSLVLLSDAGDKRNRRRIQYVR